MKSWNSSPHPISDIRDWHKTGRLEIRPDFQRKAVWSDAAKIMLIDTVLRSIPMPKVFVASSIKDQQVHRTVIDGQQRITAILSFLNDEFALLDPYAGEYQGLVFSQLPPTIQAAILQYRVDFNEAIEFSDEELRETYSRLNKYSVALTKQELRRADYPGRFLALSEQLASLDYLEEGRIFTVANRRRLADVEYVSELLAALIAGPQDKRDSLDSFYLKFATWDQAEESSVLKRFMEALSDIQTIFDASLPIHGTRFKQKADLYSLLLAIDDLRSAGGSLSGVSIDLLRDDLRTLDQAIEPESTTRDLRSYAIRCVSQANSIGSRRWRQGFLRAILTGTFLRTPPTGDAAVLFARLWEDWDSGGDYCASPSYTCPVCDIDVQAGKDDVVLGWAKDSKVFQLSNVQHVHRQCLEKEPHILLPTEGIEEEPAFEAEPVAQGNLI